MRYLDGQAVDQILAQNEFERNNGVVHYGQAGQRGRLRRHRRRRARPRYLR